MRPPAPGASPAVSAIYRYEMAGTELDEAALVAGYAVDRALPWLRVNFVSSLDGAVAAGDGYSAGLSGVADKRVFRVLRMMCDCLLVGAGTLRHEGYGPVSLDAERRRWRLANGLAEFPTLVVVSRSLDLSPAQTAFTQAPVRPLVLTAASAPADRRAALQPVADVITCGDTDVDLITAVALLRGQGMTHILCEGGPHVLAALTAASLVDELCLTLTPLLVGPGPGRITAGPSAPAPVSLPLRQALVADGVLLLRYAR